MNSLMIALNHSRRIVREYQAIILLFVFPLLTCIISVNINTYYSVDKVGVSDKFNDKDPIVKLINSCGKYKVLYFDENEIKDKLIHKDIDIGVTIPEDYGKRVSIEKSTIKIICNIQNANVIYLRLLLDQYIRTELDMDLPSHLINAKNNIGPQKTSMGFFLLFIMLFSGTCTGLLLEDKKNKTYLRYFSAPIKEYELYLGTFITNLVLGIIQIFFFLLISNYLFNFDWKIPVFHVFLILVSFLLTSIGISICLIGFIKDTKVYTLVNALVSIFTCFFGGAYFSSSLMGENLDRIANLFPQKWAIMAYEKLVDGQQLGDIQQNLLILLLFAAVYFSLGVNGLRPSESDL